MGIDAPNLQGANQRQVLAQGDQVAQTLNQTRRDNLEFQSRLDTAMVERALRARDQTEDREMVVHRREDEATFSAGDAMLGGGRNSSSEGSDSEAETTERTEAEILVGLAVLPDPFGHCERIVGALRSLGRREMEGQFQSIDRRLLAGLLEPA